jgi:hypothetical protein
MLIENLNFIRDKIRKAYVQGGHEAVEEVKANYPKFFVNPKRLEDRSFMMQPKTGDHIPGAWVLDDEESLKIINGKD